MREFAPPGVLGLIVAGLLAAFVSTFAATLNAAPAYLVNDVYRRHINPQASRKRLIYLSYAVSIVFVYLSAAIGLYIPSINSLLIWIVSGLWGGYTAANVLKWYWWRFNGYGFFTGMLVGMVGALALPRLLGPLFPQIAADVFPLYSFPLLLLLSLAGCFIGDLPDAGRRHGRAEGVLPARPALGILGPGARRRARRGSGSSRSTATSAATCSTSSSAPRCRPRSWRCRSTSCCAASTASPPASRWSPWAARSSRRPGTTGWRSD